MLRDVSGYHQWSRLGDVVELNEKVVECDRIGIYDRRIIVGGGTVWALASRLTIA